MTSNVENDSIDELEPEISWVKGVPGDSAGGTPPGAIWRPPETWRRVLRTILGTLIFIMFRILLKSAGVPGVPVVGQQRG